MGLKPLLACLLLTALALAGCSDSGGDGDGASSSSTSRSSTTSGAPLANRAPLGSAGVAVNGTSAAFTLNGTDPDGDSLTWALDFGDGAGTNGTTLPANATHDYGAEGLFNVTYTLSDGNLSTAYNLTVNATVALAAATQGPQQFTGTVTCAPTFVAENGQIEGSGHEFIVEPGQTKLTISLAYEDPSTVGIVDLDIVITDATGEEATSENVGPEPPVEFEDPAAGTWRLAIVGYSCVGTADYTVDAIFG